MSGELTSDEAKQPRNAWMRAPFVLALLLALALAFGLVPGLEDRTPRRGSFALPPASRSKAPERLGLEKQRRTAAAPGAGERAVEGKAPAAVQQAQAAPEISAPADPAPAAPPADPTLVPQLPQVPELVEEVNVLLGGLPAPAGSEAG